MPQIDFEYETTEGIILHCTADITEGRPGFGPDLSGPGEPAEDPTIEIVKIEVKDFDFAAEEIEGAAWIQYEDQGGW